MRNWVFSVFASDRVNSSSLISKLTYRLIYKELYNSLVSVYTRFFFLKCIVLYWRGGHCCPMHCDLFNIFCAPLNLGITRTWICRLILLRGLFFRLEIIRLGIPSLNSLPEDLCSGYLRPEKNPSTSAGFEPANLGSRGQHVTPRPPRPTSYVYNNSQNIPIN